MVKEYNSFFQSVPVLVADTEAQKIFRLQLSDTVGKVIAAATRLLGMEMPERM